MNDVKTRSVESIARAMAVRRAFAIGPQTNATLWRGKGYTAALRKLHPGEQIFLTGARQVHQLAHRIFGKGNCVQRDPANLFRGVCAGQVR